MNIENMNLDQIIENKIDSDSISDKKLLKLSYALKYMDMPRTEYPEHWVITKKILMDRIENLYRPVNDYGFKICNGCE